MAAGAILLGTVSVSAVAQTNTVEPGAGYVTQEQQDDEFPWGLLGLLGLAGLLGLKRRDDDSRINASQSADRR